MKKHIRKILNIVLSALLIFSIAKFSLSTYNSILSRRETETAVQIAYSHKSEEAVTAGETANSELPVDDPLAKELLSIELDALQAENEDVIGWISIPDTKINYPLLQNEDNAFYLSHTWQKNHNPSGSVFMDCKSPSDFSSFNSIIYGHNMMYDEMFSPLHQYRKSEYMQEHPYVYIASAEGVSRYEVYAAGFAGINTIVYGLNIEREEDKQAYLSYAEETLSVSKELSPALEDSFITLSTCTGGDHGRRMVVIAALDRVFKR